MDAIAIIQWTHQKDEDKGEGGSVYPFKTLAVSNRNISH